MYVCMYVCVYVCRRPFVRSNKCMQPLVYLRARADVYVRTCVCVRACVNACVCVRVCECVCACVLCVCL